MKLIGVAHLHIFARCPVVVIQGPVVTRFWCLVHWSAKISWTDVIGNNVRRRAQGFRIVEGIAPGTHVLVFTTQVKVRVHVDQIGELIVQISGRCTTCTTIELKSGCSSHLFNHTIYVQSLDKTKCCCSSKNRRASLVEPSPRRSLCSHCAATAALRWSKDSVEAPEEELGEALDDDFVRQ